MGCDCPGNRRHDCCLDVVPSESEILNRSTEYTCIKCGPSNYANTRTLITSQASYSCCSPCCSFLDVPRA
ncbi:hypothetical protein DAPPUDRAFT_308917 [Daphnia pulex]|uniref:Uncharacterized protein n=1 Tax=Daphnia pulex TaxID=6669 RepID=E9HAA3_DAPPU|nr:hypothetical protein DAPPUDRAFT_308917 [Daphnia pulex]|eukprot:EFX71273.1 hypothetical protein DAPPUDRAFT_308917 [Daphnia pulex]